MRSLVAGFSRPLGRGIRLRGAPGWLVRAGGAVVPLLREVGEMLYQWDEPFVVDDRRFRERFSQGATNADVAAAATVAWARRHYGSERHAAT
jgi:hypothetical protein